MFIWSLASEARMIIIEETQICRKTSDMFIIESKKFTFSERVSQDVLL